MREMNLLTPVEVLNKAQDDMINKFGIFVTYFLFMLPKYDRWYKNRIRQIKVEVGE